MTKHNIIFDLDATLIHSIEEYSNISIKEPTKFVILNFKKYPYLTLLRNHMYELLEYCFENFNVGFWSAGEVGYVNKIIEKIISKKYISKINIILARKSMTSKYCVYQNKLTKKNYKINFYNGQIVKSLDLLFESPDFKRKFNKKNTILIDDYSHNISINPLNSIHIPQFCNNKQDDILLELLEWFKKIKKRKNVQTCIKNFYKFKGVSYECER